MIRYGFQRLVLLGSAGYQRAELPLDDAVSLIAPNNTGKTSLINALQFLLIIDRRRMDFGSHDWGKTRQFYFPNNSAYILLEVVLPQTGTVVFGCVGKGVSHEYEYFAYKGELNIDEFRHAQGHLIAQPQLINHLASQGRTVYRYDASEFARVLYGGTRRGSEPDFTVFKLEHSGDAKVFQQVLTRTLRLDKLSSNDVKKYLLDIFRRDLPDANIDFKQEWDKAFHEVHADQAQYNAAVQQLPLIEKLEQAHEARLTLRGKILVRRAHLDETLPRWQQHFSAQDTLLSAQIEQLDQQRQDHTEQDRQRVLIRADLKAEQAKLNEAHTQQEQLARRFALVANRTVLEQQYSAAKTELEQLTSTLLQADGRSLALIEQDVRKQQQRITALRQQKNSLHDNLFLQLSQILTPAELERLNRVLNQQAMVLAPNAFSLDPAALRAALANAAPEQLALAGLTLTLETLNPQHQQLSEAQLEEQLEDALRQETALGKQLTVAQSVADARQQQHRLEQEKREREQDLTDYEQLQDLLQSEAERVLRLSQLEQELQTVDFELANAQQQLVQLHAQREAIFQQQQQLGRDHRTISQLRDQRADTDSAYQYLDSQAHHLWLGEPQWGLDELAQRLQDYQADCQKLPSLDNELTTGLRLLHGAGLTKYQYSEQGDLELTRIFDFSHQLPQEKAALEKKARSAVVNVTASLRELRDGLHAFQGKMREFNRLISHRQLSDLKIFKIEAEDESHLVQAIDTLINAANQVDSGDSFDLFNQHSVLDDAELDQAKQTLVDEGHARQGLKVADLFRLIFVVAKVEQQPESFQDIDSAASNGTVLMAKLVTGLAMLHLMQDKRHQVHAICYLDEALALDSRNQANLITTAEEFGFALIFASPAPLTTARYCVPIHHEAGANHISRESWQILTPLSEQVEPL